jgi:hypothetical protein
MTELPRNAQSVNRGLTAPEKDNAGAAFATVTPVADTLADSVNHVAPGHENVAPYPTSE